MYVLQTEQSFDAAHFLKDYKGKCSNIHGHRWRVVVQKIFLPNNKQKVWLLILVI